LQKAQKKVENKDNNKQKNEKVKLDPTLHKEKPKRGCC